MPEIVREPGIGFVAYSPLGRGLLIGGVRDVEDLADNDLFRMAPRFACDNLRHTPSAGDRVWTIAENLGVAAGQLASA